MSKYRERRIAGRRLMHHVSLIEKVLGRQLKGSEQVHHVDSNSYNNENSNLVVCPNKTYHALLHIRTEALEACGDASFRKCSICKQWSDPDIMINADKKRPNGKFRHNSCMNAYHKNWIDAQ